MAGCATQKLPKSWEPLDRLVERGKIPGLSDNLVTTVVPNLYVPSISEFNKKYPEGSTAHEALRRHETEHAKEQKEFMGHGDGLTKLARLANWLRRYTFEKNFRWKVEQKGYKAQILYLRGMGQPVYPEALARILSGPSYHNMVGYEEALEWVKAVLRGDI